MTTNEQACRALDTAISRIARRNWERAQLRPHGIYTSKARQSIQIGGRSYYQRNKQYRLSPEAERLATAKGQLARGIITPEDAMGLLLWDYDILAARLA